MKSCFMATDLKYYELELRLSTLERDDLIAAIFKYLVALYIALLCCIIFSTRLILKSVFRPLDRLLEWLENVSPGHPAPYLNPDCRIREFRTLHRAALEMHERAEKAYREQRNSSKTPLMNCKPRWPSSTASWSYCPNMRISMKRY